MAATEVLHLTALDPRYPSRLRGLAHAPASLSWRGGEPEAEQTVAVVGSREAAPEALLFAESIAAELARAGIVVVSGGAEGIDAAAHRGALRAGGRTWVVAGTGHGHVYPTKNAALFDAIQQGPGAMLWPFPSGYTHRSAFLFRNRVLVALSDVVVVVQAGDRSGALNAASWARKLRKPLWVVPVAPWTPVASETAGFEGSKLLLAAGARPLFGVTALLRELGVSAEAPGGTDANDAEGALAIALPADARAVLRALRPAASHIDAISERAGLSAHVTASALLTLALEDVVVEGPPGFFRRRDTR